MAGRIVDGPTEKDLVFDESLFEDNQEGASLDFETLSRELLTDRMHQSIKQTLLTRCTSAARHVEVMPQPFQIFAQIAGKKTTTLEVKGSDGIEDVKVRPCRLSCADRIR